MSSRLAGSLADRLRSTLFRRGRIPGLRTAKATFAVVAAYLLTAALGVSDHPMVAPLVALLVVQLTLYKTVVHGIGKVVAVLAGVLVAVLVANVAGVTWWSLGAVVAGSFAGRQAAAARPAPVRGADHRDAAAGGRGDRWARGVAGR